MANFPFDLTLFLPPHHQAIQVEGRPARVRVISDPALPRHEDWAIASIIPMPNQLVHFPNVQQILGEFITQVKHLGFHEICQFPFGQAYVRLRSPFDRDALVLQSPHMHGDVHIIFQRNNQCLNWRNLELNRDIWVLLAGLPFDKREMHEIAISVRSFGKLLLWDRARSTQAALMVKIRVDLMSDVPISIVVGESDDPNAESWTVLVVIIQQEPLGGGPLDEDPIPVDGNPHPQPVNLFFHPNQLNHFLGPIEQHQAPDVMAGDPQGFHHQAMMHDAEDANHGEGNVDDEEELPGWGHWPLEDQQQINLPDMDMNSELTLSVGSNGVDIDMINDQAQLNLEGNGILNLLGQAQVGIPDFNLALGPMQALPLEDFQPLAQQAIAQPVAAQQALAEPAFIAPLDFINLLPPVESNDTFDIDLNQVLPQSPPADSVFSPRVNKEISVDMHLVDEEGSLFNLNLAEGDDPIIQLASPSEILAAMLQEDDQGSYVDEKIEILDCSVDVSSKPDSALESIAVTCSSSSTSSAPLGFNVNGKYLANVVLDGSTADSNINEVVFYSAWEHHFSVSTEGCSTIKVPFDWVDFICSTLLTPEKFDWAKRFLLSTMWHIICEGFLQSQHLVFYIPNNCPVTVALSCS
ncbi:hypothetical protein VPH35_025439 [Triticum aestivum]